MDEKEIVIGVEYHISTIVDFATKDDLFQGVVLEKVDNAFRIRVTQYTISEQIYVGQTMKFPSSRFLRPVATTNQGFVSLLSKED